MFRHLVITGRSRLALYFARIPAGLAIIVPMVAVGFTIVCAVCVFAAPTKLYYDGVNVPPGLTLSGFESWAAQHPKEAVCGLPYRGPIGIPCFINGKGQIVNPPGIKVKKLSEATMKADAIRIAQQDYTAYSQQFLSPSTSLMVKAGLWIELEAVIGFIVGLGLGSLLGQRTVSVVLMLVLEVVLTPIFIRTPIRHLINFQRSLVGLATAHLEPGGLPTAFSGGNSSGVAQIVPETTTVAVCVIVAWLVVWTALGAWRMANRDA
jgi:hypothetical protein